MPLEIERLWSCHSATLDQGYWSDLAGFFANSSVASFSCDSTEPIVRHSTTEAGDVFCSRFDFFVDIFMCFLKPSLSEAVMKLSGCKFAIIKAMYIASNPAVETDNGSWRRPTLCLDRIADESCGSSSFRFIKIHLCRSTQKNRFRCLRRFLWHNEECLN